MSDQDHKDHQDDESGSTQALVPIVQHSNIAEGIQAFRRGDMIIYTIRGEPDSVQELMGELSRQGVGQVVALISHPAPAPAGQIMDPDPESTESSD